MSEFFEIAYAAVTKRLCFFTGSGFSSAISNNSSPTWESLLIQLCDLTEAPEELKETFFDASQKSILSLEEIAQVIQIELDKIGKCIYEEISNIVKDIRLGGDIDEIKKFFDTQSFRVVTTNYDKLTEELSSKRCQSISPGNPIPRSSSPVKIYHVHGSVDSYTKMIVTANDYYNFINIDTYFSRKLSTILHENTLVILGYKLGDSNLKAIINDYKNYSLENLLGSSIFFISRSKVNQYIKDYYYRTYSIRVIDEISTNDFFNNINRNLDRAKECSETTIQNIRKIILKTHSFSDDYLKVENSFYEILSSINAVGFSYNNVHTQRIIIEVIKKKKEFTSETGAWVQYEILAKWLTYLLSIVDIRGMDFEEEILNAVRYSMENMSRELKLGYSWHAYNVWSRRRTSVSSDNRLLIKNYLTSHSLNNDVKDLLDCF